VEQDGLPTPRWTRVPARMGQGRVCRHDDGCAEAETGGGGTGCVRERMGGGCRSGVDVGRNGFAERAGQDGRGGAEAGGRAAAVDAGAGVGEGHGRAAKAGDADAAYGAWWSLRFGRCALLVCGPLCEWVGADAGELRCGRLQS
jgi:hypothetical protein